MANFNNRTKMRAFVAAAKPDGGLHQAVNAPVAVEAARAYHAQVKAGHVADDDSKTKFNAEESSDNGAQVHIVHASPVVKVVAAAYGKTEVHSYEVFPCTYAVADDYTRSNFNTEEQSDGATTLPNLAMSPLQMSWSLTTQHKHSKKLISSF